MFKKLWHNLTLTTLLAAGIALLWGFVAAWGIIQYEAHVQQQQSYESLAVDASGNAWIQVSHYGSRSMATPNDFPFRTLEGEPLESPKHNFWIDASVLSAHDSETWQTDSLATNWGRRIHSIANTSKESWYLVHDGETATGHVYLVGYDRITKLPIGYVGSQGFRAELPDEDQWFSIPGSAIGYSQGVYAVMSDYRNPRVSIATADGWFSFDVRQREFRVIDDSEAYFSVSVCKVTGSAQNATGDNALDDAEADKLQEQLNDFTPSWPEAFVARQEGRIVVQNPETNELWKYEIPADYRDRQVGFYFLSPDRALLDTSKGLGHNLESMLVWINSAGEVEQEKPIRWNRYHGPGGRATFSVASAAAPLPLVMGTMVTSFLPFQRFMPDYPTWQESGYLTRLQLLLDDGWPALLMLGMISAVLTWLAMRWHGEYSRPHTGAWAVFVFLLGVPGFSAYWAYHHRPPLVPCPDCGQQVPRDRNACAKCRQPFAEPGLRGTEVFA